MLPVVVRISASKWKLPSAVQEHRLILLDVENEGDRLVLVVQGFLQVCSSLVLLAVGVIDDDSSRVGFGQLCINQLETLLNRLDGVVVNP